ncbi:FAD-dependent oxidoreductase [uncultured Hydrogenophaga sp.]|uniref:NAD(P)/FAD-dependent oxidoreductase n=1 Tax=uncultured Hydrogenophaga sp. TaxID=199683 RepID=UPI00258B2059|nr:FAD-dependent oxidoreductase [uncultured Hydrogenophaga sp.]
MRSIAIAGASLAGLHAARALRAEGHTGRLVLIGAEAARPYDRPPLSKHFLLEHGAPEEAPWLEENPQVLDVEWRLGRCARALDLARREIHLDGGESIAFDGLVIATGASPRRLPMNDAAGVHVLRGLEDARALRADLAARPARVAIVGAGFIGLEVAASCRRLGLDVTLIEPAPVPLARLLGEPMGRVITELHRQQGVDLRTGVSVAAHEIDAHGRLSALQLSDGSRVPATVAVVAIGVSPDTQWLRGSGLEVADGVLCDETCLAADGVVAAGDVARWPNVRTGETRRVEHWDNAIRQARYAARRLLLGAQRPEAPYAPLPWFWSDQYDRKLQLYGSAIAHDECRVVEGSAAQGQLIALYRRGDALSAVLCINKARSLPRYRALLERGAPFEEALAASATAAT